MLLDLFRKKKKIERIASKDVTDAIARCMEKADHIRAVVIVYETTEEFEKESSGVTFGCVVSEDTPYEKINYLLDIGKKWIFD